MNEFTSLMVFLLMPGILGIIMLDSLIEHKPWSPFLYTVYAVVFGVGVYMVEQLGLWAWQFAAFCFQAGEPAYTSLGVWRNISGHAEFNPIEMAIGTALAVPLAALFSRIVHKKYINRIAKRFRVSSKHGDENLFSYFLNSDEVLWVYVRDIENDLTYQGMVESCSESGDLQEIVLLDASVFRYANSKEIYTTPRLYLARQQGRFIIESAPEKVMSNPLSVKGG